MTKRFGVQKQVLEQTEVGLLHNFPGRSSPGCECCAELTGMEKAPSALHEKLLLPSTG